MRTAATFVAVYVAFITTVQLALQAVLFGWQCLICVLLKKLCLINASVFIFRYIDSRAENGLTALHLAAVNGSLECVRLLLDGGASMMVRTVDLDVVSDVAAPAGSTPLHVAAMTGHVAILQAMLQVHVVQLLTMLQVLVMQVCSKWAVPCCIGVVSFCCGLQVFFVQLQAMLQVFVVQLQAMLQVLVVQQSLQQMGCALMYGCGPVLL